LFVSSLSALGHLAILDQFIAGGQAELAAARERGRKWRAANPGKATQRYNEYVARNPDRAKAVSSAWRAANRADLNAGSRKWAAEHPEERREANRAWREANPEKAKEIARVYAKWEYDNNPQARFTKTLRNRVYSAVTRQKGAKSARTLTLIGCSVEFLKGYLEAKFRDGMTWENQGPYWHIDHIKPCAKFDLTKPAEQRACFHFTNLQPLLASENLAKGDTYDENVAA
jgi:hypothetical protein